MVRGEVWKENYLFFLRRVVFFVVFFFEEAAFLLFFAGIGFEKISQARYELFCDSTTFTKNYYTKQIFISFFHYQHTLSMWKSYFFLQINAELVFYFFFHARNQLQHIICRCVAKIHNVVWMLF